MLWLWLALGILLASLVGFVVFVARFLHRLELRYLDLVVRIFEEKPLFIVPRAQPPEGAEDVRFPTTNGLELSGCYLRTTATSRRGVILFGLEYGASRWSCVPYCQMLLDSGFDVFAYEPRNQGESDRQADYDPLQWVTDFEVDDARAALAYLKSRPDRDQRGVGFFGISKGASAGLLAACRDPFVRCFVTDGMFATRTTMLPYMKKWVSIVSTRYWLHAILPSWVYGRIATRALNRIESKRNCHFPELERAMRFLGPRPLLMIHGEGDTYIKPEMAQRLYARARRPKELWIVPGAKHNLALQVAATEYKERIEGFFCRYIAGKNREVRPLSTDDFPRHSGLADSSAELCIAAAQPTLAQRN